MFSCPSLKSCPLRTAQDSCLGTLGSVRSTAAKREARSFAFGMAHQAC